MPEKVLGSNEKYSHLRPTAPVSDTWGVDKRNCCVNPTCFFEN